VSADSFAQVKLSFADAAFTLLNVSGILGKEFEFVAIAGALQLCIPIERPIKMIRKYFII
jgi:hypothetical protein